MSQFDSLIIGEVAQDTNVDYDGTTVHAVGGAVRPGAVLGGDGFGFAPFKGEWIKIPQRGRTVLGADVEIGANTTIHDDVALEANKNLLKMLAPFTPHITEELWQICGFEGSVHQESWPEVDKTALVVDEIELPIQVNGKVRDRLTVAVDADRRRGIRQIRKHFPETNLILLDDAFQHRYVTPSTSILLTDINRLIYEDKMLPAGRLREPLSGKSRANIVIVTKCPDDIKPIDFRIIAKHLQLYPYQRLYFTTFRYGDLTPVFPRTCTIPQDTPVDISLYKNVVAVSGIASPHTFIHHIHTLCPAAQSLTFADHHDFTARDITRIKKLSTQAPPDDTLVIVTEKDAARLMHNRHIDTPLKQRMLYLPLRVAFLQDGGPAFDAQILDEAKKNSPSYIPQYRRTK